MPLDLMIREGVGMVLQGTAPKPGNQPRTV